MINANPIIVKRKPTIVKKKPLNKPVVVRKKKQKVILKESSTTAYGQLIKRKEYPYWKEKGWRISYLKSLFYRHKVYVGTYRTKYASFKGEIIGDNLYIFRPSREILRGPHGPCFTPVKSFLSSRKYIVHFSPNPPEINSKIKSVEQTVVEGFAF